jgi:hypothetical protein
MFTPRDFSREPWINPYQILVDCKSIIARFESSSDKRNLNLSFVELNILANFDNLLARTAPSQIRHLCRRAGINSKGLGTLIELYTAVLSSKNTQLLLN